MDREELFATARKEVLGTRPTDKVALVGYNMAASYYEPIIRRAEAVLLDLEMPTRDLSTLLGNAFDFSSYPAFRELPEPSRVVLHDCCARFQERYGALYNECTPRVA